LKKNPTIFYIFQICLKSLQKHIFFRFFQQKYGKTGVNLLVTHMKILLFFELFQTPHIFYQSLLKVTTILRIDGIFQIKGSQIMVKKK